MGVVYKARQLAGERIVALKLIRDGALAGPQELARFRIEAEAAARMRHPNIVQIYEIGEHQGRPYFAMELIEGQSLAEYLGGRPQPPQNAAELVRTLALAVQHAHDQQIVHRDLKPANVLLHVEQMAPSAAPESLLNTLTPKITDFGLAKRLDSQSTAWTLEGAILGTASYMAPEQAAGRARELGPAVDVYALGALLYELLTGRPPFLADSWQQTVQQVLMDEPAPPTRLIPKTPRDLESICLKCLEKEAHLRYATARELADDLSRFLGGKAVAAIPLSATDRIGRLAGRDGFEIVGVIGHGPRSTVFHALQRPAKQPVAIKVFLPGLCSQEEWNARLRQNAEVSTTLAHPNIVPINQSGWWDGMPYTVMEHMAQGSLAGKISGQPGSVSYALDLMAQLAAIVSYLHRQGVIHGNLKPSNVLLAADDIPRVADFRATGGLFLKSWSDSVAPHGLAYLPPEAIRDAAELRFYTDIYGLGAIFYEVLTGEPPFRGESRQAILDQLRSQSPVPPSQINANVTPQIESACLRSLHKNPWMRYNRAYDFYMRMQYLRKSMAESSSSEKTR
jgi:serine/threonine protein kinase